MRERFLPICRQDMKDRGWDRVDFVYITGDAYVDHPSFWSCCDHKTSGIQRLSDRDHFPAGLEGQRQCDHIRRAKACIFSICRQYGFHGESLFCLQKAQKIRCLYARRSDGQASGLCNRGLWKPDPSDLQNRRRLFSAELKRAFEGLHTMITGLTGWKRSVLLDSGADMISYGMGEHSIVEIAEALDAGIAVSDITYISGDNSQDKISGFGL